jgi:hypothetical protein
VSKRVVRGYFVCEDADRYFSVKADLYEDGSLKIVKGKESEVLSKSKEGDDPITKSAVLPMFREVVAKAKGQVTKAASGNRGAGEADSLMLDPSGGIKGPSFVPNGGFVTPTGLGNSSARLPNGQPPIYAEIDAGGEMLKMSTERRIEEIRRRAR